jgi:hypothetical protein
MNMTIFIAAILLVSARAIAQESTEHIADLEKQVVTSEKLDDRRSDQYVGALYQLIALRAGQDNLSETIRLWQLMLEARRALLGDSSPEVVVAIQDLAVLHRLNRQWQEAGALEQRAQAIAPVAADEEAIKKPPAQTQIAMNNNPGLTILCDRTGVRRTALKGSGFWLPIEIPLIHRNEAQPAAPTDSLGQARVYEQDAECLASNHKPESAILDFGYALDLRMTAQGSNADLRETAKRMAEFCEKSGDRQCADRARELMSPNSPVQKRAMAAEGWTVLIGSDFEIFKNDDEGWQAGKGERYVYISSLKAKDAHQCESVAKQRVQDAAAEHVTFSGNALQGEAEITNGTLTGFMCAADGALATSVISYSHSDETGKAWATSTWRSIEHLKSSRK